MTIDDLLGGSDRKELEQQIQDLQDDCADLDDALQDLRAERRALAQVLRCLFGFVEELQRHVGPFESTPAVVGSLQDRYNDYQRLLVEHADLLRCVRDGRL